MWRYIQLIYSKHATWQRSAYSGRFSWYRTNCIQTLTEKFIFSGDVYSGHCASQSFLLTFFYLLLTSITKKDKSRFVHNSADVLLILKLLWLFHGIEQTKKQQLTYIVPFFYVSGELPTVQTIALEFWTFFHILLFFQLASFILDTLHIGMK